MTDAPKAETAARIELPGGWYFLPSYTGSPWWRIYGPDETPQRSEWWGETQARTFVAALASKAAAPGVEEIERVALAIEATMFAPHELPCEPDLHQKYLATARAAIAARPAPVGAVDEAWHDVVTHRDAWRSAIASAHEAAAVSGYDNNASYWKHELQAFDRTFAALSAARQAGETGDEPKTGEFCSVCGQPQFDTPHGTTCINGHGGAPGVPHPGSVDTTREGEIR